MTRSTRPLACGLLAQMISISSSCMARPNWVSAWPDPDDGHIDPKNAVFVAVEGHWLATPPEIAFGRLAVAEKALALHKEQLHQLACRIVDEHQQDTRLCSSFKPVMRGTIDLHQFAKAGPPFSQLMHNHFLRFAGFPQAFFDHELAHTFIREFEFLLFHQLLMRQRRSKALIFCLQQIQGLLLHFF